MLGTFKIIAGDFKAGSEHQFVGEALFLKRNGKFFRETVPISNIAKIERVSDDVNRKAGRTVGWGIAGAVIAGPLGAVAAGMIGGKKAEVNFVCHFRDGRKFLGSMGTTLFTKLEAPFLLEGDWTARVSKDDASHTLKIKLD